jgi:hypothetical protein
MHKDYIWQALYSPGFEHLQLEFSQDTITANSLVIFTNDNIAKRIQYKVVCDLNWIVREVTISELNAAAPSNHLLHNGRGEWTTLDGTAVDLLQGCAYVDITVTPFTNTLPIRRLNLKQGEAEIIQVAYFDIENATVNAVKQRYTNLGPGEKYTLYRYEGLETGFTTEIEVDNDGIVVNYPNLWQRVYSL